MFNSDEMELVEMHGHRKLGLVGGLRASALIWPGLVLYIF